MILAQGLHKSFGAVRAVRGISFEIPAGQIVGLLGPNGAGKSTTIRMLCGLLPPDSGAVSIDGSDSLEQSIALRRRLGYLPENNPIYPEMRVREYLTHRARLHRVPRAKRAAAVERALETCWLRDVRDRRVGALSKGYRQRVGLGAALVHEPAVLLLDEPTSGLDPAQIIETRALLRSLAGRHTVILSSHILPEVEKTCERLIIIGRGRVLADGSPRSLVAAHKSGVVVVEFSREHEAGAALALSRLEGVDLVEIVAKTPSHCRLRVTPGEGAGDLREAVGGCVTRVGATMCELRFEDHSIETLFTTLIESAEGAA